MDWPLEPVWLIILTRVAADADIQMIQATVLGCALNVRSCPNISQVCRCQMIETTIFNRKITFGLLRWFLSKEPVCQCRRPRFDLLGEGNDNPLQYSHLGDPMDRGSWWAPIRGITKESDTTQPLNKFVNVSLKYKIQIGSSQPNKTRAVLFHTLHQHPQIVEHRPKYQPYRL